MLHETEIQRYSRQIALEDFGREGQEKLKNGKVLVIGAGALGSSALLYLAAAGVGTLGIADGDKVDISNLQRQVIHSSPRLRSLKVESAARSLQELNPLVKIVTYPFFVTPYNIEELITQYDFVIDATDSPDIKFLVNDACVEHDIPFSHGAIKEYSGQLMTVIPGSANYRDLFDTIPAQEPSPKGPLGVVPGVIGTLQACEAIKFLTGVGDLLTNRILIFQALPMTFTQVTI